MTLILHNFYSCYSKKHHVYCIFAYLNFFLIIFFFLCIITVVVSFPLIFVDLSQHGLTGSDIGSIVLSLPVPILTLIIGKVVERHLRNQSSNGEVSREDYENLEGPNNQEPSLN